jgi:hypothetical protein
MSKKITVEIDVPEFEGYEFVRYGMPVRDEYYLSTSGNKLLQESTAFESGKIPRYPRPVYQKAVKWRPATLADVQRALDGETVAARFGDDGKEWTGHLVPRHLVGVCCTTGGRRNWYSSGTCYWNHCEVRVDE